MAELARGAVADRPWGRTVGALGLRGLSGQLTVSADRKHYQVAFADGAVVGATSPLASDAVVRVALTSGFISSTQVSDLSRRQAGAPRRDEIELISELARLTPEQALRLRRRTVAQRAARTFSIERGDFVVDDQVTISVVTGTALDIRSIIYLGALQNLSEARLGSELAEFGAWFRILPGAYQDLPQFGFSEAERGVLERLREGARLEQLEAVAIEARAARAMVYALVSCNACEIAGPGREVVAGQRPSNAPWAEPSMKGSAPPHSSSPPLITAPTQVQVAVEPIDPTVGKSASESASDAIDSPTIPRRRPGPSTSPAQRTRADSAQAADVQLLIKQRLQLIEHGADHYTLFGVLQQATPDELRKAYFALARVLHPDRLSALGIVDQNRDAQRLFAQVNTAFAVLSNQQSRFEYTEILRRGGEAAVRAEQAKAETMALRILDAEEAFRRGEHALRRDQHATAVAEFARAMELNPDEADYHALHAWAQFCTSSDKLTIASATRTALELAIAKSPKAVAPRFYLGRVERMLGRDHDALRLFQEVLKIAPQHIEAAAEARVIEARLASGSGDKGGGGMFRKR